MVGSPYYAAPEVFLKDYGKEADIWSAGVIIYILLCGVPHFLAESENDIFEKVLNGEVDFSIDPWPNISESAKELVKKMLVRDPKKRITAHEVLCHPWISIGGVAPWLLKGLLFIDKTEMKSRLLASRSAIDYEEFIAATLHFKKVDREDIPQAVFSYFDKDGSDYIIFSEIQQYCKDLRIDDEQVDIIKETGHPRRYLRQPALDHE